ncbi:hypothetical protein Agub_g333 [Astrephomene gubernaculifera]|uniref:C3H1-type domain-containing protein n=1 Tax=Astrephomene gubernaculifera TaxID=47775 RepID=A0AAD3DDU7_9CHLO|nr:hypothetical protein Agub_g333 [Astrephomene gubernaculifera]
MLGQPLSIPGQAPSVQGTKLCHLLSDEALLRRLSGNTGEDCVSALRALNLPDSFWTDEFKVVPCAKTYSHKWTLCPCAHIGETARRRCPRTVNYKAVLCPLVKAKKTCPLGDSCSYAHNVFEHWLHPSRYKTRLCSFGRNCNRSICFFAHSADELRCVPCTDDKEGDERDYLMQLIVAQENGLLPPTSLQQLQPAPMPPPLVPSLMPDLSSALQQALQQPLPPSNRPSINGLPDALSGRPSMSGLPDLHTMPTHASLAGLQDANSAAVLRASFSGVPDASSTPGLMVSGRPSMNGLPDPSGLLAARTSLNGLQDGLHRARTSLNGLGDPTTNMLFSMSVQNSMQRALSSDINGPLNAAAMHRALSTELSAPFHAAAMQRALSNELGQSSMNAAAAAAAAFSSASANAAAAAAMERAFSSGAGSASPLQSAAAAAAAMERAYSLHQRESLPTQLGGAAAGMDRAMLQTSRSVGSGGVRRELTLAHTPSLNSVESDSLIQMRSGVNVFGGCHSAGIMVGAGSSSAGAVATGLEALANPQAPTRLSDPGASFQVPAGNTAGMGMPGKSPLGRVSEAGNDNGNTGDDENNATLAMLGSQDLSGFQSLLPLVNNALANGGLPLPTQPQQQPAARRSTSGSQSSSGGRVVSPPLREGAGSPSNSGSVASLSPNSSPDATNVLEIPGGQQQQQQQQQVLAQGVAGSPPKTIESLAFDAINAPAATGSGDQAYLQNLVAHLQDHGVNKEQLVSSLSQLLVQLLSVGN